MPSEASWQNALSTMARERDAFYGAVAVANEQLRHLLARQSQESNGSRMADQLGWFADGRIDTARFAAQFTTAAPMRTDVLPALRFAQYVLKATLTLSDDALHFTLPEGEDLRDVTTRALAICGRVFAAAHTVAAIRNGNFEPSRHEPLMAPLPPDRWTRAERAIAPPLVIELQGADLRPGGFETLLQGGQKIVLLVKGDAAPAPLVRLITPHVFVAQCGGLEELAEFSRFEGAGIAALLPDGVHFVHQPASHGRATLRITRPLTEPPRRRIGAISAFQQTEELRWLQQLEFFYNGANEQQTAPEAAPHQAGDQLAAWLLKQAQLS